MELLILGGLSVLGNELSKRSIQKKTPTNVLIRQDTNTPKVVHQTQPSLIDPNMIHNNMVPFYKSQRSQNTNDAFKDRRLSTFTGVDNIDYKKKTEILQSPPQTDISHPYGVTFQPDIERYKNYVASGVHNNVSPVEKQYIGPGLGSTTNSTHGFHEMFRIMPDNINVYRKNNLPGMMNHGNMNVASRSTLPGMETSVARRLATEDNQYINGVMSSVQAATNRPIANPSAAKASEYQCTPPSGPARSIAKVLHSQQMQPREHGVESRCGVVGNPASLTTAQYNTPFFLTHSNERDKENCQRLGVQLSTASVQRRFDNFDHHTLRDTENCHRLNVSGNHRGVRENFVNHTPTQRGVCANTHVTHPSLSTAPMKHDSATHAVTQRDTANGYTAQPHYNGGKDYTTAYFAEQNMAREHTIMTERTPIAGRRNIVHDKSQINMDIKNDANTSASTLGGGVFAKGVQNFTTNQGTTATTKTIDPINNRMFGFVSQNNPYAIDINQQQSQYAH
jgi:hypothetical protein